MKPNLQLGMVFKIHTTTDTKAIKKLLANHAQITQHKQSHKVGRILGQSRYVIQLPNRDLSPQHLKFADCLQIGGTGREVANNMHPELLGRRPNKIFAFFPKNSTAR